MYVIIEKYGIEGLVCEDNQDGEAGNSDVLCTKILPNVEEESAELRFLRPGSEEATIKLQLFDHLKIQVKAEIVEFRRSLSLHFRGKIGASRCELDEA